MTDGSARRYYRAMEGRWRGRLALTIDLGALATASLGTFDRLAWRFSAWSGRALGPPWLETSVDATGDAVIHTTRVRQLGASAASGLETITIDPDGRRFVLRGTHRFAWAPWRGRPVEGTGEVAEDARGARYAFDYLGARLVQTTRVEGEALVVRQETAFSLGEARLERVAR